MIRRIASRVLFAVALSVAVLPATSPQPAQARSSDDDSGKAERKARAKEVRDAAESGNVEAQVELGWMHAAGGQGVRHSYKDALKWWKEASDQGSARATFYLGELYRLGKGVDEDPEMAVTLYRKAAEKNDAAAQDALGRAYMEGEGVTKNAKTGISWIEKSVAQNHPRAFLSLGMAYLDGIGVTKDKKEGARLVLAAAEMGNGGGQLIAAVILSTGEGVARDDQQALTWALLADSREAKGADKMVESISARLSPSQRDEAERQAKAWKPKKAGEADNDLTKDGKEDEDGASSDNGKGSAKPAAASSNGGAAPRLAATGSGFYVSATGHILTNHHVIDGCTRLDAGTAASGMAQAQVVADDTGNDLAVLKVAAAPKVVASFRSGQIRQAEGVMAYGFPLTGALATDGNATSGNITALAGLRDDTRFFQMSAPVQPGNSGGPLLDLSGNVVGVVVSKLDALRVAKAIHDVPQNVNFAIKNSVATSFLESHGISYAVNSLGSEKSSPDLSDQARSFTVLVNCSK